jgi:hypothetical protein
MSWLNWSWQWRARKNGDGKWTKPPMMARDPRRNARSNDPTTWSAYNEALARVTAGDADGLGFALLGSNIAAVDLDLCQDNGEIAQWAGDLCDESNAYVETTVSGAGLRIIGTTDSKAELHTRFALDEDGAGVELYRNAPRYITISGLQLGTCAALPPIDAFIDGVRDRHRKPTGGFDFNTAGPQATTDYDEIIKNGVPEGGRSEAFNTVVWHLAGQGFSSEQITDELAKYPTGIGAKYAGRLHQEVERCFEKWRSYKYTCTNGNSDGPMRPCR